MKTDKYRVSRLFDWRVVSVVLLLVYILLSIGGFYCGYGFNVSFFEAWAMLTLGCLMIWAIVWIPLEVVLSKKARLHAPCSVEELANLVVGSSTVRGLRVGSGNNWSEYYIVIFGDGLHSVPLTKEAYECLDARYKELNGPGLTAEALLL